MNVTGVEENESSRFVDHTMATEWEGLVLECEKGMRSVLGVGCDNIEEFARIKYQDVEYIIQFIDVGSAEKSWSKMADWFGVSKFFSIGRNDHVASHNSTSMQNTIFSAVITGLHSIDVNVPVFFMDWFFSDYRNAPWIKGYQVYRIGKHIKSFCGVFNFQSELSPMNSSVYKHSCFYLDGVFDLFQSQIRRYLSSNLHVDVENEATNELSTLVDVVEYYPGSIDRLLQSVSASSGSFSPSSSVCSRLPLTTLSPSKSLTNLGYVLPSSSSRNHSSFAVLSSNGAVFTFHALESLEFITSVLKSVMDLSYGPNMLYDPWASLKPSTNILPCSSSLLKSFQVQLRYSGNRKDFIVDNPRYSTLQPSRLPPEAWSLHATFHRHEHFHSSFSSSSSPSDKSETSSNHSSDFHGGFENFASSPAPPESRKGKGKSSSNTSNHSNTNLRSPPRFPLTRLLQNLLAGYVVGKSSLQANLSLTSIFPNSSLGTSAPWKSLFSWEKAESIASILSSSNRKIIEDMLKAVGLKSDSHSQEKEHEDLLASMEKELRFSGLQDYFFQEDYLSTKRDKENGNFSPKSSSDSMSTNDKKRDESEDSVKNAKHSTSSSRSDSFSTRSVKSSTTTSSSSHSSKFQAMQSLLEFLFPSDSQQSIWDSSPLSISLQQLFRSASSATSTSTDHSSRSNDVNSECSTPQFRLPSTPSAWGWLHLVSLWIGQGGLVETAVFWKLCTIKLREAWECNRPLHHISSYHMDDHTSTSDQTNSSYDSSHENPQSSPAETSKGSSSSLDSSSSSSFSTTPVRNGSSAESVISATSATTFEHLVWSSTLDGLCPDFRVLLFHAPHIRWLQPLWDDITQGSDAIGPHLPSPGIPPFLQKLQLLSFCCHVKEVSPVRRIPLSQSSTDRSSPQYLEVLRRMPLTEESIAQYLRINEKLRSNPSSSPSPVTPSTSSSDTVSGSSLPSSSSSSMGEFSLIRWQIRSPSLISDMRAFQAAFPDSSLSDFLNWAIDTSGSKINTDSSVRSDGTSKTVSKVDKKLFNSPSTPVKSAVESGLLSSSSSSSSAAAAAAAASTATTPTHSSTSVLEFWNEYLPSPLPSLLEDLWRACDPCPAQDQKPLFRVVTEAEKCLTYFENLTLVQLYTHCLASAMQSIAILLWQQVLDILSTLCSSSNISLNGNGENKSAANSSSSSTTSIEREKEQLSRHLIQEYNNLIELIERTVEDLHLESKEESSLPSVAQHLLWKVQDVISSVHNLEEILLRYASCRAILCYEGVDANGFSIPSLPSAQAARMALSLALYGSATAQSSLESQALYLLAKESVFLPPDSSIFPSSGRDLIPRHRSLRLQRKLPLDEVFQDWLRGNPHHPLYHQLMVNIDPQFLRISYRMADLDI